MSAISFVQQVLNNAPDCTKVSLRYSELPPQNQIQLLTGLKKNTFLRELDLQGSKFGAAGVQALAAAIKEGKLPQKPTTDDLLSVVMESTREAELNGAKEQAAKLQAQIQEDKPPETGFDLQKFFFNLQEFFSCLRCRP